MFCFAFLAFFEMKLRVTPKVIYMGTEGSLTNVELFKYWGFGEKTMTIPNANFKGVRPYFKRLKWAPCAGYNNESGKKKYLFFTTTAALEKELLRDTFNGYHFKVGPPEMNIKISKKAKKEYKY